MGPETGTLVGGGLAVTLAMAVLEVIRWHRDRDARKDARDRDEVLIRARWAEDKMRNCRIQVLIYSAQIEAFLARFGPLSAEEYEDARALAIEKMKAEDAQS